jgi:hypothetical protein
MPFQHRRELGPRLIQQRAMKENAESRETNGASLVGSSYTSTGMPRAWRVFKRVEEDSSAISVGSNPCIAFR